MIYQHFAQRTRAWRGGRRVGTITPGTIVYIQDGLRPPGGMPRSFRPVLRDPYIVESWKAARGERHLAVVRSLRNGRRHVIADWLIRASLEACGH